MFGPLNLRRMASLREARRETRASEFCIPYAVPVDDHTVKTFEGHLLQTIRVAGLAFDTEDRADINLRKRIRNQLWRTFSTSEIAIYTHVLRRCRDVLPEGRFEPGFARNLDAAWQTQLRTKRQFTNDIYITVVHKQGAGSVRRAEHLLRSLSHKLDEAERIRCEGRQRALLEEVVAAIVETLKPYLPERLGAVRTDDGLASSELLKFLGFLLNLEERNYVLPRQPIAQILPTSRPIFQHETIELHQALNTVHAAMMSIKEYDDATAPHMMDKFLSLPIEFVMAQSFRFEDRTLTEAEIERQRGRLVGTGDKGLSQIDALDDAMEESKGGASFGTHHCSVLVWHKDSKLLAPALASVANLLAEQGLSGVRESANLEACFYAQLPGNFKFITRGARISTKNFASFASLHNHAHGRRHAQWGPALTVVQTESGTPHYLNLHIADRGNTLVLGPTGRGKTLTVAFLLAQSLKYGGRRVILDKDRGLEIFVRAVRGKYFRIETGKPTGWNPLQLTDTPASRAFLADLFEAMVTDEGEASIDSDDRHRIARIVASVFDIAPAHRILRHVAPMFGNPESDKLARRLLDWYSGTASGQGRFAWMFDNNRNELDPGDTTVAFDLTHILDNRLARRPALLWLFFIIESLIDGRPMAIFADEGWKLLDDALVAKRIENFEFVIRKNNGLLIFATQAPESVIDSAIAPAIRQQSETCILFPNPKADEAVYRGYLGLNAKQFDLVSRTLPERGEHGWFLLKNSTASAVCRLDLTGMEDFVAVLSGNRNTVALLDELLAAHGDDPDNWLPHFRHAWRSHA